MTCFLVLAQLPRTMFYLGSLFLKCTLETSEHWHWDTPEYSPYVNLLVLVIRNKRMSHLISGEFLAGH